MSAPEPTGLRDLALEVARQAAALVAGRRATGVSVADTKSSGTDVVTEADRASEELIRGLLIAARPDDAILGEEGDDRPGTSGVRWIVDPIDGTVNFLYGLPQYAVSIAAEWQGEIVAGAVVNVPSGVEYAAARGHGSTRDGVPLRVRPAPPLHERLIMTGFGYIREVRVHQAACIQRLLPEIRDIRRMGSSALDICQVAEGTADGYVEEGSQPWDWAAASLVLTEAGGRFAVLPGTMRDRVPGWPEKTVVTAAPADGWDDFVTALETAGFLAVPGE